MRGVVLGVVGLSMLAGSTLAQAEEVNLEVAGLVEVEATSGEDFAGDRTSDVTLATVELALDAELNQRVSAHLAFLYEEDATDFGLDEGTLTLGLNDIAAFTAGRMYVPFGRFDSFMISDPQTLEMAETVETVLMLSLAGDGLYGFAYLFNGDAEEQSTGNDDNHISSGLNIGYARDGLFDVGLSYISNIADSETLQALEDDPDVVNAVGIIDSRVAGAGAYFSVNLGPVTILGEHITALDNFSNGDLDGMVGNEEKPAASNIEVGVVLPSGVTLAAAYQKTDEAAFIGLPESVVSATLAYEVVAGATLAAEYASLKDYGVSDGGTGESGHSVTVQLAVEF